MIDRFRYLFKRRNEEQELSTKTKILFNSRTEVDINANGTSGYVVKHGPNKGKVLAHKVTKSNSNW